MTTLNELYECAETNGNKVYCLDTRKAESMSVMIDGDCAICINPFLLTSYAEEKVKLAHELGHCETVSFYDESAPWYIRERCEARAEKWAIKKLIPKDELVTAFKDGICDNYDLAEHFGVTEDFMRKALKYYSEY